MYVGTQGLPNYSKPLNKWWPSLLSGLMAVGELSVLPFICVGNWVPVYVHIF